MSVVCCRVYKERIEIASDDITVRGYTQTKDKDRFTKLSKVNDLIIGSVGSCEESSLLFLFASTHKPAEANESALVAFIAEFAEWKRKKTNNFTIENHYLIAFSGHIFLVEAFFVKEILQYEAIGAGMNYALAALHLGHDVEKAVEVACDLSVYCEKPVRKYTIPKDTPTT